MQVDEKALEAARQAYQASIPDGAWHADGGKTDTPMRAAIDTYLSALGEQEPVAWPRGTRIRVEHDGFEGVVLDPYITLEGKRGQVCQLAGARVVHVYGEKWLQHVDEASLASPLPVRPITDEDVERAGEWRDPNSGFTYTAAELAALLEHRDSFIVSHGLWSEYVASLDARAALEAVGRRG